MTTTPTFNEEHWNGSRHAEFTKWILDAACNCPSASSGGHSTWTWNTLFLTCKWCWYDPCGETKRKLAMYGVHIWYKRCNFDSSTSNSPDNQHTGVFRSPCSAGSGCGTSREELYWSGYACSGAQNLFFLASLRQSTTRHARLQRHAAPSSLERSKSEQSSKCHVTRKKIFKFYVASFSLR